MNRIVFTGGGTAGHVTPNLALIPVLRERGWEIHYIGTEKGMERELIAQEPGVTYHPIEGGKLRRYLSVKNITDAFRVLRGIGQSASLIKKIRPTLVFSKGGFVSVPVVYGAWLHRVPVLLHESDMTPGLANRLSKPFAKKLLCGFPEAAKLARKKGVYTGTPVRKELLNGSREAGKSLFGFDDSRPILLVTGGSSGAQAINSALRSALPRLTELFQVLHLCGQGNLDPSLKGYPRYCQKEYLGTDEMAQALACADAVVSRAGATTLCELLALYKPTLLVPYPKAKTSRGDQILNAASFESRSLSRVLQQEDMTPETLVREIVETYKNRGVLIDAMEKESCADGLTNVLAEILKYEK